MTGSNSPSTSTAVAPNPQLSPQIITGSSDNNPHTSLRNEAQTSNGSCPKFRITPFDGNPKNWNLWFGLFKTLIDSKPLHDAEKMSHLQTLTVGRANEAIRGFSCNSSPDQRNYPLDNQNHYLGHCETFRKMSAGNRKKKCLELKRCFHCLGTHTVKVESHKHTWNPRHA